MNLLEVSISMATQRSCDAVLSLSAGCGGITGHFGALLHGLPLRVGIKTQERNEIDRRGEGERKRE